MYDPSNNSVPTAERFDDMFYHYSQDKILTVSPNKSQKEDRFQGVLQGHKTAQGETFLDVTGPAYGEISAGAGTDHLAVAPKIGDALYIGHPWPFQEVNLNVLAPAPSNWKGTLEYWDGASWRDLTVASDTTSALYRSGKIRFAPPSSWQRLLLKDRTLYWLRLRCTAADTSTVGPVLRSIVTNATDQYHWGGISAVSGEKYARVDSPNQWVIPGWDPANDRNYDGYVDDEEFARRVNPLASARFRYQSRVPSAYYSGRWQTKLDNPDFLKVVQNEFATDLQAISRLRRYLYR